MQIEKFNFQNVNITTGGSILRLNEQILSKLLFEDKDLVDLTNAHFWEF